jgi:hypothetical protein
VTWRIKQTVMLLPAAMLLGAVLGLQSAGAGQCKDPMPLDPDVITREMGFKAFSGANQFGPVCHLNWEAAKGAGRSLLIYGPTAMAGLGQKFSSARQAAEHYQGESPKGVEPVPGIADAFMVFDPKTPNRRLFVEHRKKVYMINSDDRIPMATIAKAVIR